jgi:hypothetical protein
VHAVFTVRFGSFVGRVTIVDGNGGGFLVGTDAGDFPAAGAPDDGVFPIPTRSQWIFNIFSQQRIYSPTIINSSGNGH